MRKSIMLLLFVFATAMMQAQTMSDIKTELYKVNKRFDSTSFLAFTLTVLYNSDTIYGRSEHEEVVTDYILNDKLFYYNNGRDEYIQNDSFVFSINHDYKQIVMTRDVITTKSSALPLKYFIDSVLTWYDTMYRISFRNEGELNVIELQAKNTTLSQQHFALFYDTGSYYPDRIEMDIITNDAVYKDGSSLKPFKQRIVMTFGNYRHSSDPGIFENSRYVYYDRMKKRYVPSDKYKKYSLIADGIGQTRTGKEMYPPPTDN